MFLMSDRVVPRRTPAQHRFDMKRIVKKSVLAHEFPHAPELVYLNHAAVAPWPRRAHEAVTQFAEENIRLGATRYPQWLAVEQRVHEQLARLVNAPSAHDIALVKNTSEGLSMVAYGLAWKTGDNVVVANEEFPSNRIVWESLRSRGVETRVVPITAAADPEQALLDAIDSRTRLLSLSSVQFGTGRRMDLARVGAACRARHVLFCVDAIQSLGALAVDVQHINADFLVADAHKWLLGPEGLAVFYCRAELRERLALTEYGWHMVEHAHDFEATTWTPAASARRFECGSPNMLGIHALAASLSLFEEVGIDYVEQNVLRNSALLLEQLSADARIDLLTPREPGRYGGIVTFRVASMTPAVLVHHLREHHVICAPRGGGVRFSPHFYTPRDKLERAVRAVQQIIA